MLAILTTLALVCVVTLTNFVIFGNIALSFLAAIVSVTAILIVAYNASKYGEF